MGKLLPTQKLHKLKITIMRANYCQLKCCNKLHVNASSEMHALRDCSYCASCDDVPYAECGGRKIPLTVNETSNSGRLVFLYI